MCLKVLQGKFAARTSRRIAANNYSSDWPVFDTSTGLHKTAISKGEGAQYAPPRPIHWYNLCVLYHRKA